MKILSSFSISLLCCVQLLFAQNTSDIDFVSQTVRNNQNNKNKISVSIALVKKVYESQSSFPQLIKDGWHDVISTDHGSFCYVRKVYVENNRVTKYIVDDWRSVKMLSTPISQAKSIIQLLKSDGSNSDLVEVFFLQSLKDSNSVSNSPVEPGSIFFWSDMKRGGDIQVFVDGKSIGTLGSYFQSQPQCGQQGTILYTNKPGTYQYKATAARYTWNGTITIVANSCNQKKLGN